MPGEVVVNAYGSIDDASFDPSTWPSGDDFLHILQKEGVEVPGDAVYWQASARLMLLHKYGYYAKLPHYKIINGLNELVLTDADILDINKAWETVVAGASSSSTNDFIEFLRTGKSNARPLKWSAMQCPAGTEFKLHAHPNIELIYCADGDLHEVRMKGEPITKEFEAEGDGKVAGPNLSSLSRPWYFDTLKQGTWLVNEVGSIHKSFTASKGNGCVLIVLWGGSHADITPAKEPTGVNVTAAVREMDGRLAKCDCTAGEKLQETFLPASERST